MTSHSRVARHTTVYRFRAVLFAALLLTASLHAAQTDSLQGSWQLKGDVMGNALSSTCTFTQNGAALGGTCAVDGMGTYDVTGEVKDGTTTFWHGGDYNGDKLTLVFTVASASPTEIKGDFVVKPFDAAGTFTMTPATAKP